MKNLNNPYLHRAALAAAALVFGVGTTSHAADYNWGGGTHDWSDTSPTGWNGGPPGGGDTAIINSGAVTLTTNNLTNSLASVTIGGTGKLTQTTDNTWSAFNNLTLSGGTLESVRSSGDAFGSYQISNTAYVTGSSASTISTNGSGSIFINLGLAVNNSPTFTTFSVNDVTSSAATDLTVSTVLANNIATNFVSFSAAGLIKTGAGTMTLSANNIYTAGTTVNEGVLEITGSSAGNGYIRGTVTVNSGAELRYSGGDGTGFGFNGGNKLDTIHINGGLVNSVGTMTHLYGATVNMTGGELRVNNGTSDPGSWPRIDWNNTTLNTLASASTASITGRINLRGDGGYSSAIFEVADGSAATDLLVSAAVTEQLGSVGITKNGAGTMELAGTNSYTGGTTVNGGTLLVNGSTASESTVTVASGAMLGGTGTISGNTTVNGTLNAGNGGSNTETLAFGGTLDLTGTTKFDIAGTTRGTGYDGIDVTGALTNGGTLSLNFTNLFANGEYLFDLFNLTSQSGDFSSVSVIGSYMAILTNSSGIWSGSDIAGNSWTFTQSTGDLAFTAVPEPTGALAGLLLTTGLLRRRRIP